MAVRENVHEEVEEMAYGDAHEGQENWPANEKGQRQHDPRYERSVYLVPPKTNRLPWVLPAPDVGEIKHQTVIGKEKERLVEEKEQRRLKRRESKHQRVGEVCAPAPRAHAEAVLLQPASQ